MVCFLAAVASAPVSARAQETDADALHRAVLLARDADRVQIVTRDGRTLEGKLVIIPGDSVRVLDSAGRGYADISVAPAEVVSLSVRSSPDREPVRIGGFVGGQVAGLAGYAVKDVNTFYMTAAGTVIGYGIGTIVGRRNPSWRPLYPPPPPDTGAFGRDGWFIGTALGMARADASRVAGATGNPVQEWFLAAISDLGVTLSPNLALTFGVGGWVEPDIIDFDAFNVYSTFGLRGYWTPGVGLVVGAGGGAAVGEHNTADDDADVTDWGWSVSVMAAWEFRIGKTTLIGPAVALDTMRFGGDYFDDATFVTCALRLVTY